MLNTITSKKNIVKPLVLVASSLTLLFLASCGNEKNNGNANTDVPHGMVAVDLSAQGLPILVNIPDSNTASLEIIANAQGGADVKVGKNFQMTIAEGQGDISLKKNDIAKDDVRKLVRYVVDEPNFLVWEWKIEGLEPDFHFYAIVKDGEKFFEAHEVDGEIFSEKSALLMLDAAKSIHLKTLVKAES
jgi:hypothetical protein